MLSPNAICVVTALFIVGMAWLRTRLQYAKEVAGRRRLTRGGAIYFGALGWLLLLGWFVAPVLAGWLSSSAPVAPTLARVVWFLVSYYLFIPVHRVLRAHGVPAFRSAPLPEEGAC
jgi:hypothetical protein